MSLSKRMLEREIQAEELNRSEEDRYYGEPWPTDEEMRRDAQHEDHQQE